MKYNPVTHLPESFKPDVIYFTQDQIGMGVLRGGNIEKFLDDVVSGFVNTIYLDQWFLNHIRKIKYSTV